MIVGEGLRSMRPTASGVAAAPEIAIVDRVGTHHHHHRAHGGLGDIRCNGWVTVGRGFPKLRLNGVRPEDTGLARSR